MTGIIYIDFDGVTRRVDALPGTSVMKAAVHNDISGILGECGGACACATCHVYIEGEWKARLPPPSDAELEMLECASNVAPDSRLGCQITITEALDGLIVRLPASQS
jgi:2Fe-2S ferredoxin